MARARGGAEVAFQQLVVVEAEKGDAVAGADAFGQQPAGQALATLSELRIGEARGLRLRPSFCRRDRRPVQAADGGEWHVHGESRWA